MNTARAHGITVDVPQAWRTIAPGEALATIAEAASGQQLSQIAVDTVALLLVCESAALDGFIPTAVATRADTGGWASPDPGAATRAFAQSAPGMRVLDALEWHGSPHMPPGVLFAGTYLLDRTALTVLQWQWVMQTESVALTCTLPTAQVGSLLDAVVPMAGSVRFASAGGDNDV